MKIYKNRMFGVENEHLSKERGFITIATGAEKYHKMAYTLLTSYRAKSAKPMRFCVITDRENWWTEAFDDVVIIEDARGSYNDKIDLIVNSPYGETIFIDADCIAYGDLNRYWSLFENASDISAFGEILPLNQGGWFPDVNKIGEYRERVTYGINLHGGIYFFKKSETLNNVYCDCKKIMSEYHKFLFKDFAKPADEPVIALAMASNHCKPIPVDPSYYVWLKRAKKIKVNFFSGKLEYCSGDDMVYDVSLLHFGTSRTIMPLYLAESSKVIFYDKKGRQYKFFEAVWNRIKSNCIGTILIARYAWKLLNKRKHI